jgi:hypothetical protein
VVDGSFIPDPAMVSLITTSLWFFVAFLKSGRNKHLYWAAVVGCLGVLTKLTGALVGLPAAYAIFTRFKTKQQLQSGKVLKIVWVGILVLIPVIAYYSWAFHLSRSYPPFHFAGSDNWIWNEGLKEWLHQGYFLYNTQYIFRHWSLGWPFIGLCLVGLSAPLVLKNKFVIQEQKSFFLPWFFHWWFLGFLFFYIIGAKELTWNFWNFHLLSPVVAAFSSRALFISFAFIHQVKWQICVSVVVFILIAISNEFVYRNVYYSSDNHASYEMGLELKKHVGKNDLVVVIGEQLGSPVAIYYSGAKGWVFPPHEVEGKPNDVNSFPGQHEDAVEAFQYLQKKGAKWLGIVKAQYENIKENHPLFFQYLQRNFPVVVETNKYVVYNIK